MKVSALVSLFESSDTVYHANGAGEFDIDHVSVDSRVLLKDSAFCALKGSATDGHLYWEQAVAAGAKLIISEKKIELSTTSKKVPNLIVPDLNCKMNLLVEALYPEGLGFKGLIGVTGTNGKSTIATLIKSIFDALDERCALIGTILFSDGIVEESASHTTPPYHTILRLLNQARQKNVAHCAIEASSHALSQNRLGHLKLRAAIFTNLTQDHLDYHDDLESYEAAKIKLLDQVDASGFVIVNLDNSFGQKISDNFKGKLIGVGRNEKASYVISQEKLTIDGSSFSLRYGGQVVDVKTSLIGGYNVDNLSQVIALFIEMGYSAELLLSIIANFEGVPGRVEKVGAKSSEAPVVIVDYAHTHDAMENVLKSVAVLKKNALWVVFGCGGDRDRKKRPLMAAVAEKYGDRIIITNDNPRTEDPMVIIGEIKSGILHKPFDVYPDRKEAIEYAISNAASDDIVMILGKGHEDYQVLAEQTIDFDDRLVAGEALENRKRGA